MTDDDNDPLVILAGEVADGRPVDWQEAHASATADEIEELRQLRAIAEIARVHRGLSESVSQAASVGLTSESVTAAPPEGPRWGPLVVLEQVGAGSYGEVFRAWDTTLAREVALKLLRRRHRAGADSIIREGHMLARVSHANVMAVYGAREIDGQVGVWSEFLRGRTLAQLVADEGPLSADEALVIADSISRALAAAHKAGLLHRDVKAHNVIRERGGRIVLMDFGLGRQVEASMTSDSSRPAGTPLYLAPELFAGGRATVQSDLYSLGVLMFYLVTGTYPVTGNTVEEIAAAHASGQRAKLQDLRPEVPTAFVQVVERALEPDPKRRFESAGAVQAAVTAASHPLGQRDPSPAVSRALARPLVAAVLAAAITAAAGLTAWVMWPPPTPAVSRRVIAIEPPPQTRFSDSSRNIPAISPDGRRVALVATDRATGKIHLWLHSLETATAMLVPDSERALAPFWDADSKSLGFFEPSGRIKHVTVDGVLMGSTFSANEPRGATVNRAGVMLFPKGPRSGIFMRPLNDQNAAETLVLPHDPASGELGYMWPQFLPDGDHFIYFVFSADPSRRGVYLSSLKERFRVRLLASDASAIVSGDRLLYVLNDGDLVARRFNLAERRVTGGPVTIARDVATNFDGRSMVNVADDGTIVYLPARENTELVWFDRTGVQQETLKTPSAGRFRSPALSWDGEKLALQHHRGALSEIHVFNVRTMTPWRVVTGANVQFPVWGPGHRLAYTTVSPDRGRANIYERDLDSDAPPVLLYAGKDADDGDKMPTDWSRDGKYLLFVDFPRGRLHGLWKLPIGQPDAAAPLRPSEGAQVGGRVSPDGRRVLYVRRMNAARDGEPPERELWMSDFPSGESPRFVARGGIDPSWPSNRDVSFFDRAGRFTLLRGLQFAAVTPETFTVGVNTPEASRNNYAWMPDGSRVLVNRPVGDPNHVRVMVVMDGYQAARP